MRHLQIRLVLQSPRPSHSSRLIFFSLLSIDNRLHIAAHSFRSFFACSAKCSPDEVGGHKQDAPFQTVYHNDDEYIPSPPYTHVQRLMEYEGFVFAVERSTVQITTVATANDQVFAVHARYVEASFPFLFGSTSRIAESINDIAHSPHTLPLVQ